MNTPRMIDNVTLLALAVSWPCLAGMVTGCGPTAGTPFPSTDTGTESWGEDETADSGGTRGTSGDTGPDTAGASTSPEGTSGGTDEDSGTGTDSSGGQPDACSPWTEQVGTDDEEESPGIALGRTGEVYVAGTTRGEIGTSMSAGGRDPFVVKYASDGTALWRRQLGTEVDDYGRAIALDGAGDVYVVGGTSGDLDGESPPDNGSDVYLAKLGPDGAVRWIRQFGSPEFDTGAGIAVDETGVYLTGRTFGVVEGDAVPGTADVLVAKYTSDGQQLWLRQFGTSTHDNAGAIAVDESNHVYVTGNTLGDLEGNTSAGDYDMFLTKLGPDGTMLWTRQFGAPGNDDGRGVATDGADDVYVTGYTHGDLDGNASAGGVDAFVTKVRSDGTRLWTRQLGTAAYDAGAAVAVGTDDVAYVSGSTGSALDGNTWAGGSADAFVAAFDTGGVRLWTQQFGSDAADVPSSMAIDDTGALGVAGITAGALGPNPNAGQDDVFVARLCPWR